MFGIEQLLGGVLGGKKDGGGVLGETKEAIIGGCWGLLMSGAFFFFFFFAAFTLIAGISDYDFKLSVSSSPLVLLMCVSGLMSPFIGVMFGLQGGRYSAARHVGCFVIYLGILIAGAILLTIAV